ncbi:capsid protein [Segnochrobactrum spirostomi]|uniref:Capsid protein n=1 Tax=Segnochrobactrum spirostomi TaxID=2608987 RepID=A0A6A7Y5M4_9HYPH|nr:capsid protein [Segnochrobactrum spirostomi]MQT13647.1 capsid protein [Segnochrobactrum spirostomi]
MSFPFPVNPVLTGIVIAYKNAAFIADRVFPRVGPALSKREFKWNYFPFGQQITIPDGRVGRKSEPNVLEFETEERTGSVVDFGFDDIVPNDDIANAPEGQDPRAFAAERLADTLMLVREQRVAAMTFDPSTYPTSNVLTLSGSSQWSSDSSHPVDNVIDAKDSMVADPNVMVIGRAGWSKLRRNPQVIASIRPSGTQEGVATLQAVADLFELDAIVVGSAFYNAARPGQPVQRTRLWGNSAALLSLNPLARSIDGSPTFGWTAEFGTKVSGTLDEPKVGLRGSVRVRVGESVREIVAAPDLGFLFQSII